MLNQHAELNSSTKLDSKSDGGNGHCMEYFSTPMERKSVTDPIHQREYVAAAGVEKLV